MNNQNKTENRNASLDVLRIICIILIILGHMCTQSEISKVTFSEAPYAYLFNLFLGNSSRWAINCFVMISAWFLCDRPFKSERFFFTWFMTFIINVVVTMTLVALKKVPLMSFYTFQAFLPIIGRPQWYMCEYMLLLLLTPFLNAAIKHLPRKNYLILLVIMFFFMTGVSTVVPFDYTPPFFSELMWFVFLYLFIAYTKVYGIELLYRRTFCFFMALAGYLIITVLCYLSNKTEFVKSLFSYYSNHYEALPGFIISLGIFFLFLSIHVKSNRLLTLVASSTGVIYILHQVPVLWRYESFTIWNGVFSINATLQKFIFIPYCLFVLLSILCIGTIFYKLLKSFFSCLLRIKFLYEFTNYIDVYFSGELN